MRPPAIDGMYSDAASLLGPRRSRSALDARSYAYRSQPRPSGAAMAGSRSQREYVATSRPEASRPRSTSNGTDRGAAAARSTAPACRVTRNHAPAAWSYVLHAAAPPAALIFGGAGSLERMVSACAAGALNAAAARANGAARRMALGMTQAHIKPACAASALGRDRSAGFPGGDRAAPPDFKARPATETAPIATSSTEEDTMSKLYVYAGIAASIVLIAFGAGSMYMGFDGRDRVRDDLAREMIVGTDDSSIAGQKVDTGSEAQTFAATIRKHTLESTEGQTYAQMGRFLDENGNPTSDEAAAAKDPKTGQPVENGLRNLWVTSTALSTALNTAYFAESVATFAIVMGVALLLVGVGFLVLIVRVLLPMTAKSKTERGASTAIPTTA
jgi:hypothetical protein